MLQWKYIFKPLIGSVALKRYKIDQWAFDNMLFSFLFCLLRSFGYYWTDYRIFYGRVSSQCCKVVTAQRVVANSRITTTTWKEREREENRKKVSNKNIAVYFYGNFFPFSVVLRCVTYWKWIDSHTHTFTLTRHDTTHSHNTDSAT